MDSENVKDVEKTEKKVETVADVRIFENQEFGKVRTILIDDEPWFVGKDVAEILGYSNPSEALMDHVDDDDKLNSKTLLSSKLNSETISSLNLGQRGGWLIPERCSENQGISSRQSFRLTIFKLMPGQ